MGLLGLKITKEGLFQQLMWTALQAMVQLLAMRSLYAMMARARLAQWPQTDQHDSAVRTARHPCAQMGRTYLCVLVPHATLVQ